MTLLYPGYLLVLLLAAFVWVGPCRAKDRVQGVLRSIALALIAAALARPVVLSEEVSPTRVWIVDASPSIQPEAFDAALQAMASAIDDEAPGRDVLVVYGDVEPDTLTEHWDRVTSVTPNADRNASPLAAAMILAACEIPSGHAGSITVLTDGMDTHADDGRLLAAVRERGIPVNVAPARGPTNDVRPVDLYWRGDLRVGLGARLVAVVAGQSGSARIVLEDDDGVLAETEIVLDQERTEIVLSFEPNEAGFKTVRLRVDAGDDLIDSNNVLEAVLPIQNPRRVAYLGSRQQGGADELQRLLGDGFEVTDGAGDADAVIRQADLVLLDDIAASDVPVETQRAIVDAVTHDGLGLVMSGGRSSFGAGGWRDTMIEDLLPVELVQKEEKRDPSTTLVVVIDTSGSMSGTRVQLAKEVARLAIRRLMPHDKVGIVEFYGAKRWAAPIQPASNSIEIERALNRLDAGGGTVILPAIEEAFYGMQNINTRYKHVLVLTDGGVEAGAFEPLLRQMAIKGVNVTTVLVGGGIHSEFLVNIANWGKGRFYSVPNRFNLPEIIFKQPSSAKLPAYRRGVHPVVARGGRGWWGDVDPAAMPDLDGYVESRTRPGAEVLVETQRARHPVIATWRWGLGRVTTIATEPVGEGTEQWNAWTEYGRALARVLDRTASDGREAFRFGVRQDGAKIIVDARRVRPEAEGMSPQLHQIMADGEHAPISFRRRTPDHWTAELDAPDYGDWIRMLGSERGGGAVRHGQRLVGESSVVDELQVDPARAESLATIVEQTGGVQLGVQTQPVVSDARGVRARSLTPLLCSLALLVFLGELIWRRRP